MTGQPEIRTRWTHRHRLLLAVLATLLLSLPAGVPVAAQKPTDDVAGLERYQDFEETAEGWIGRETPGEGGWCGNAEHRMATEGGLQASSGSGYAVIEQGPCNDFYDEAFPDGSAPASTGFPFALEFPASGYVQQIDVHLDPGLDTGGDPLLQFASSFWAFGEEPPFRYVVHDIPTDLVDEAGWYTFTHVYEEQDGALDIDFVVSDADGRTILREDATTTMLTGEDVASFDTSEIGTGYIWFASVADGVELPIDNYRVRTTATTTRVAGDDRVATAIAVAQQFWPEGSEQVVLARSDDFPDALAGGPLADHLDAPILLADPRSETVADDLMAEIERLGATTVTLLGGSDAIGPSVEDALEANGLTVDRIGGADRYETAALIDEAIDVDADDAVVASGEKFPDALSAMSLLPTRTLLARQPSFAHHDPAYDYTLVGGPVVLSPEIEELTGGTRLWGEDRSATSAAVLDAALDARGVPGPLLIATAAAPWDALAAGAAVAEAGGYLLIVDPASGLTDEQAAVLADGSGRLTRLQTLGGPAALPDDVVAQVIDATGLDPTPEDA